MTDPHSADPQGPIVAEGVDDEPVEGNRRIFTGRTYLVVAAMWKNA